MICPMKFNSQTLSVDSVLLKGTGQCERSECAWWNGRFGICSITLDAYLKTADHEQEVKHRKSL